MLLLNQVFKILKLLHSESSTFQLSGGVVLGMFIGFTPLFSLLQCLYWTVLILVKINLASTVLSAALFALVANSLNHSFGAIGLVALRSDTLAQLWTLLYNAPIVPYTFFYNSLVMGGFLVGAVLCIPLYVLVTILISRYRQVVVKRFKTTWLFRAWMSSKLYPLYVKYTAFKEF